MANNNYKSTRFQPNLLALAVTTVLCGMVTPLQAQENKAATGPAATENKEQAALEVIQVTARRTAENYFASFARYQQHPDRLYPRYRPTRSTVGF